MESALYEGTLRHRRFTSPSRDFEYSLFMVYLDLGDLDAVFKARWLWSTCRPSVAWFRRADHYGPADEPLDESIRALVAARTGTRPTGPIRWPISATELARALILRPAMTVQVVVGIYSQALRLWLRRATFYPHPGIDQPRHRES